MPIIHCDPDKVCFKQVLVFFFFIALKLFYASQQENKKEIYVTYFKQNDYFMSLYNNIFMITFYHCK